VGPSTVALGQLALRGVAVIISGLGRAGGSINRTVLRKRKERQREKRKSSETDGENGEHCQPRGGFAGHK
jgi:hypothetical protein